MLERQRKFVEHILQGCSGADAARKAGYSEKTADVIASRLLNEEKIKAAIDEARKEAKEEAKWTKQRAVEMIEKIVDSALAPYGESRPNESAAIRGVEFLCKLLRLDEDEQSNETKSIIFEVIEPKPITSEVI